MTGNGGLGGCIGYIDLTYTSFLGFAAIGHNNGHDGDTGLPFLNRPEVVKDYAYRALLTATKVGKTAVDLFYQTNLSKSYYYGCSTGGRQGLKAAQDFPEEFDGIVAGTPVNNFNRLNFGNGHYYFLVGPPGSPTYLTMPQWIAVNTAVLAQCDGIDGVMDGVLEDPMKCQFRPESLLCGPGQTWASNGCLTAAQVDAVRKVYQPFYGNNGRYIWPRATPGGEILGYYTNYNGQPNTYPEEFLKYAVFNDPNWSFAQDFSLDVVDSVLASDLYGVDTSKTDLSEFKSLGGKLITYHGLSDGLIATENSYEYYNSVARNMSLPSAQLDEFYRFFPISGMDHCYGGNGAWYIGGAIQTAVPGTTLLPPEDGVLMKLVNWVEKGEAPESLLGLKLDSTGIVWQKEHCKYPAAATYKGTGDPKMKESWVCK
ncbi:Tannase [Dactylellina cionopaga]|nr:Tannase [Dactylellina cionopaga]